MDGTATPLHQVGWPLPPGWEEAGAPMWGAELHHPLQLLLHPKSDCRGGQVGGLGWSRMEGSFLSSMLSLANMWAAEMRMWPPCHDPLLTAPIPLLVFNLHPPSHPSRISLFALTLVRGEGEWEGAMPAPSCCTYLYISVSSLTFF